MPAPSTRHCALGLRQPCCITILSSRNITLVTTRLLDYPAHRHDAIPLSAAAYLGNDRVIKVAEEYESNSQFWSAAKVRAAGAIKLIEVDGMHDALPFLRLAHESLLSADAECRDSKPRKRLEATLLKLILQSWMASDGAPING